MPRLIANTLQADASKLSNKVQNEMPGSGKEAKKDAEVAATDVSSKAEQMTRDAKAEADKAAKKAEGNLNAAVDKFDKSVSEVSCRAAASSGVGKNALGIA